MKNALIGTSLRRTLLVAALLLAVMVTIRACSGVRGGWPSFVHTRGQSSQFHDLVSVGDTLRAQQLLAKKPELLESRDRYGRTPIILTTLSVISTMFPTAGRKTSSPFAHSSKSAISSFIRSMDARIS